MSLLGRTATIRADTAQVRTLGELKALTVQTPVYLLADGRSGLFAWDDSDLSASVTADSSEGVYVAPDRDATGANGAWVRQYSGALDIRWFGAVCGSEADNTDALQSAHDVLPDSGGTILFPAGGTGLPPAEGAHYYFDSEVTFTKSVELRGQGNPANSPSRLVYTGTGTFLTAGVYGIAIAGLGVTGVDDADGTVYKTGSTALTSTGTLRLDHVSISNFEVGVEYGGSYYHEFRSVEFQQCRIGVNNANANNLTFFGGRFSNVENGVVCNAGSGPVTFHGTSIEAFESEFLETTGGANVDVAFLGVYVENYPDTATPKGIGLDGSKFDSGVLARNGIDGVVTITGSYINTRGIVRVVNHSGQTGVSRLVMSGNAWVLFDTGADATLTHIVYAGSLGAEVFAFDFAEGSPPSGAVFASSVAAGSAFRDFIAGTAFAITT